MVIQQCVPGWGCRWPVHAAHTTLQGDMLRKSGARAAGSLHAQSTHISEFKFFFFFFFVSAMFTFLEVHNLSPLKSQQNKLLP